MENDLVSIYENSYLRGNVVQEKAVVEQDDDEDTGDKPTFRKKTAKKSKNSMKKSKDNIGGITYDSVNNENLFDKIFREMDEMGGSIGDTEDVYDADSEFEDEGDDEMISLSELRNMTLGEIVELLQGGDEEYVDDETFEDDIPTESYGFVGGEGNYKGDQGTYDGKAKAQPKSTRVKDNGDAKFDDQDTGYDPDDTEGSEGAHKGAQGTYDGKAKAQAKSSHVKGNGDADFGKTKTGYKTSSGKKEKNYF
jgi:hypothetical protein